jgi:PRTRC genetic system protein B
MLDLSLNGPTTLATALQTPPSLILSFYPFGVILRRPTDDGGMTEYPVDPAHIATLLATKTQFDTGLLNPNTLCVRAEGAKRLVSAYRAPAKTALFLEGSETPFRIPLPGLVMLRLTTAGDRPKYGVFAVKDRPVTLDTPLFMPPLPNVYADGAVCWGSVSKVSEAALTSSDLDEDWRLFLGSLFTAHSVAGKSKGQPQDIRRKLAELDARKARAYPKRDLVPCKITLGEMLAKFMERTA